MKGTWRDYIDAFFKPPQQQQTPVNLTATPQPNPDKELLAKIICYKGTFYTQYTTGTPTGVVELIYQAALTGYVGSFVIWDSPPPWIKVDGVAYTFEKAEIQRHARTGARKEMERPLLHLTYVKEPAPP